MTMTCFMRWVDYGGWRIEDGRLRVEDREWMIEDRDAPSSILEVRRL
jgi:hypothetical protein